MKQALPVFHENQVVDIAKRAGTLIMAHLNNPATLGVDYKEDGSVVTLADTEASALIVRDLSGEGLPSKFGHCLTPGIPVLSEEMPLEQQQAIMKQGLYWCVDPLDGTRTAKQYSEGAKEQTGFGVLISLVQNGEPVFGVAHYPAQGPIVDGVPAGCTYYTSANGKSAFCDSGQGKPARLRANRATGDALTMAAGYRGAAPEAIAGKRAENHPSVGGSRIIRAAEGAVDIGYMGNDGPVSFGFWDLAAPHAILKAAGGELVTMPGDFHAHQQAGTMRQSKPLRYDGSMFIEGKESLPYLPACMAAHRDTLQALGMPSPQRHRA